MSKLKPILAALLILLGLPKPGIANSENGSIFRLRSPISTVCGSGFLIEGVGFATNIHVARGLCQGGLCPSIEIFQNQGSPNLSADLSIIATYPSLDLAVLSVPEALAKHSALRISESSVVSGDPVRSLGYPHCGDLVETKGNILSSDPIGFESSLMGSSGQSGSPVLNGVGEVVGIVVRSESISAALRDKVFGGQFQLRGSYITPHMLSQRSLSREWLSGEILRLNSYYSEVVQPSDGISRLYHSSFFSSAVVELKRSLYQSKEHALLSQVTDIGTLPISALLERDSSNSEDLSALLEELFVRYNLETRGALQTVMNPIHHASIENSLRETGRSEDQAFKLASIIRDGLSAQALPRATSTIVGGLLLLSAIVALVIATLYGTTLGFVFARSQGGILFRCVKTLLVAILIWPLSFVVFLIVNRKRS